ncbi:MAG: hypothetical protein SGBAC_003052 [Bacillariaceae sp.]
MVMVSEDTQKFYSGDVVSQYAGMMAAEIPKYSKDFEQLLKDLPKDGPILDTAVGTGHMLEALQKLDPSRSICGSDLSRDMVEHAKKRLTDALYVKCADMSKLQGVVDDASVIAVLNNFALHHVAEETAKECFVEWARVLKSNGRLLVSCWEGSGDMDMGGMISEDQLVLSHRWSKHQIGNWANTAGMKLIYDREFLEEEFGSENTYYAIFQK